MKNILLCYLMGLCLTLGACGNVQNADSVVANAVKPLNVNFMLRGYCYASSPEMDEYDGHGGWGDSGNRFEAVTAQNGFAKDELKLEVRLLEQVTFDGRFEGLAMYLYNTRLDTAVFEAQDSRLYLNLQAKDSLGVWKDIEYLPSSWCGNSYHQLFLPPNTYWRFVIPQYAGGLKTQLRAKLSLKPGNHEGEKPVFLYSNSFEGHVNSGQFWRKKEYEPDGLMDPYLD